LKVLQESSFQGAARVRCEAVECERGWRTRERKRMKDEKRENGGKKKRRGKMIEKRRAV